MEGKIFLLARQLPFWQISMSYEIPASRHAPPDRSRIRRRPRRETRPADEVTIKAKEYKAEATLSLRKNGDLILKMQMNGKPVIVPPAILAKLKDARIGSAAFSTETPTGVPIEEARLKGGIILSFYYGPKMQWPKSSDVRSACRIKFAADGSFDRIETATPLDGRNSWRIFTHSALSGDIRDEKVSDYRCPLPMRWSGEEA